MDPEKQKEARGTVDFLRDILHEKPRSEWRQASVLPGAKTTKADANVINSILHLKEGGKLEFTVGDKEFTVCRKLWFVMISINQGIDLILENTFDVIEMMSTLDFVTSSSHLLDVRIAGKTVDEETAFKTLLPLSSNASPIIEQRFRNNLLTKRLLKLPVGAKIQRTISATGIPITVHAGTKNVYLENDLGLVLMFQKEIDWRSGASLKERAELFGSIASLFSCEFEDAVAWLKALISHHKASCWVKGEDAKKRWLDINEERIQNIAIDCLTHNTDPRISAVTGQYENIRLNKR
jgi:hypothetical protein